jgi:protein dpy-30
MILDDNKKSVKKVANKNEDELENKTINNVSSNSNNQNISSLTTRAYLEQSVVPVVMQGMAELAKERPDNPLEFLGNYILNQARK